MKTYCDAVDVKNLASSLAQEFAHWMDKVDKTIEETPEVQSELFDCFERAYEIKMGTKEEESPRSMLIAMGGVFVGSRKTLLG